MTPIDLTPEEVASEIEDFLDGSGGEWDWDDFTSIRVRSPQLDRIREFCVEVNDRYPPEVPGHYCNEDGFAELRRVAAGLRRGVDLDGKAIA